jgi:hypothetical protein
MPGEIDRIAAGLLRVAEDDVVDLRWRDASSFNGGTARDDAEFGSREIFERATELAEGRAGSQTITISFSSRIVVLPNIFYRNALGERYKLEKENAEPLFGTPGKSEAKN